MELNKDEEKRLANAKKKVKRIKGFYFHIALYLIVIVLLLYNFYIMEGPYTNEITGLNIAIMVFWTIFIILQGITVFKGRLFFNKRWEDRKTEEYLKEKEEEETTLWE